MQKGTILFADDDRDFLKTRKRFLEEAGYTVIGVYTPEEAKRVLNEEVVDIAVLDIRLIDSKDPKDISGILVAREAGRYVPKIMLTGYPNYKTAVEAMMPSSHGLGPAVNYVAKTAGPGKLLKAVEDAMNRRVFIVHGRDDGTKETVARFVEHLRLSAIILHEQPGGGRTIIEKFEDSSNVGFAIVLLTPDDVGGLKGQSKGLKSRARQNVIFELGYFVGKLGRRKVAVLYKKGVELPTDYLGVEYIEMNKSGNWKDLLKREIRNSGIDIDLTSIV